MTNRAAVNRVPLSTALIALVAVGFCGCAQDELPTTYGRRTGVGSQSVNGTRVLGDMFAAAGHTVESRHKLSPNLESAQTIVWFPNDFKPPKEEIRHWLDQWLDGQPGRTLIYVGRDFDAAPRYWRKIQPIAPPDKTQAVRLMEIAANVAFQAEMMAAPKSEDCEWFTLEGTQNQRDVKTLKGPWSQGLDVKACEVELNGRIVPPDWSTVLLESEGDVLISRERRDGLYGGQMIVVDNGSFLLNLPLINHEHRKLAGRLVDAVGSPGKVVFLESGDGGPAIGDDQVTMHTGFEIFNIWPLNAVVLHLAALGLIFCFARAPIFGKPATPAAEPIADFSKHIEALGRLLERSRDLAYAQARVDQYRAEKRD